MYQVNLKLGCHINSIEIITLLFKRFGELIFKYFKKATKNGAIWHFATAIFSGSIGLTL